jgi:hypothetical protein
VSYLLTISEDDLELVMVALRLLSGQRLFGDHASRAGIMAEEIESWKERQDAD